MRRVNGLAGWSAVAMLGIALTLTAAGPADARQGGSFGSRGTRTYQAPASTNTSPSYTAPVQRSATPMTQPGASSVAQAGRGGLFGNGFGGALVRGLLIGGLVGMLFGGGLGGLAGFLGLLLQAALLAVVVMFALRWFANRRQPAAAGGAPYPGANPMARDNAGGPMGALRGLGGGLGGGGLGGGNLGGGMNGPAQGASAGARGHAAPPRGRDEIGITPADFDAFERALGAVQAAFSREDRAALATLATPEVLGYLDEELRDNAARGLRNDVSEVKLLQGDLAEAWREGTMDYATVAMRYQMRDAMRDRATGALAPGSSDGLTQSTEIWTFVRPRGGAWTLSAIQEA